MTVKDKDFTETDAAKDAAQGTAEEPKKRRPRREYTREEAEEYSNQLKTSGRKGMKLKRVNLAFSPQTYDYIKTMSRVAGLTYTEFLERILSDHREKNEEIYRQAILFRKSL